MSAVNVPFEIPKGWAWCKISDVFSVERGGSPRPIKDYLTDSADGINWIKIADASASGKYITTVREKIRPQGLRKTKRVFVGDLLLTNSMSFGHPYILQVDGCIHDGWLVLHAFDSQLDKVFFYYLLSSRFVYVSFSITASGGVVQNLNADKVSDTSIPLPPLAEQKRIVACIEELFRVADSLGAAADGLENAAKRLDKKILDLAIRGKLVPQDPNDEPASELVKRIAASHKSPSKNQSEPIDPPFEIPDSWEWVRLGDLFQHNTGKALNRNGQTGVMHRYITTSNVYWDEFKLDDLRQMPFTEEELEKCSVKKGDLLVCEGGDIGRAAIWNFNQSICIQNHLHRLRPFVEVCVPFFCFVLRLYKATNRLQGRGIGLQGFSSRMLHNLPVPLPPLAEQKRIVAKIEELRTVIKSLTT